MSDYGATSLLTLLKSPQSKQSLKLNITKSRKIDDIKNFLQLI